MNPLINTKKTFIYLIYLFKAEYYLKRLNFLIYLVISFFYVIFSFFYCDILRYYIFWYALTDKYCIHSKCPYFA